MKTLKVLSVGALLLGSMYVGTASAEYVVKKTIELPCGRVEGEKVVLPGHPNMYYEMTSVGIKEQGYSDPIEVIREGDWDFKMKGGSGLEVIMRGICGCSGSPVAHASLALTGKTHRCNKGEQLELQLDKPRNRDPNKYKGVIEVREVWDSEQAKRLSELENEVAISKAKIKQANQDIDNMLSGLDGATVRVNKK